MHAVPLKYPKKSHRKEIALPLESEDLAELVGIVYGDGGVNNQWQLTITVNSNADKEYAVYVASLIKRLFAIEVAQRKRRTKNALLLVTSSMNLLDFLEKKGVVRGNKLKHELTIPKWISKNTKYKQSFIRGLVDTDGCLYIHSHTIGGKKYKNIGFCFSSASKSLIEAVKGVLLENGITPHMSKDYRKIYLYSVNAVKRYLSIFGSSNVRIFAKYSEWEIIK